MCSRRAEDEPCFFAEPSRRSRVSAGGTERGETARQKGDVRSRAEEHDHAVLHCPSASTSIIHGQCPSIHQRMRKPHFGAVDGAITGALDDGEQIVVFRIEDDALGGGLCARSVRTSFSTSQVACHGRLPSWIAPGGSRARPTSCLGNSAMR